MTEHIDMSAPTESCEKHSIDFKGECPLCMVERFIVCKECKTQTPYEEMTDNTCKDCLSLFTVACTGSRSLQTAAPAIKKAVWEYLIKQLTELKEKYGENLRVMSGMAEGFDKAFALAALSLGIKVIAVIPNRGYGAYYWGRNSLTGTDKLGEFHSILDRCEEVIYIMEDVYNTRGLYLTREGVKTHSNFIRNEYMVEHADAFYVYDKTSRGTSHCFKRITDAELPYKEVPVA